MEAAKDGELLCPKTTELFVTILCHQRALTVVSFSILELENFLFLALSCPPGHNLDAQTQECRVCPAGTLKIGFFDSLFVLGTYSLGSATRYEDFTSLPSGFNVENFADDSQQIFSTFGSTFSPASCPKGLD